MTTPSENDPAPVCRGIWVDLPHEATDKVWDTFSAQWYCPTCEDYR